MLIIYFVKKNFLRYSEESFLKFFKVTIVAYEDDNDNKNNNNK